MTDSAPIIAVLDEENREKKQYETRRSNSCHIDLSIFQKSAEEKRDDVLAYCAQYSLTQSMDLLVTTLLREQPSRPSRWCEQFIRTVEQLRPGSMQVNHEYDQIDPRELLQRKWVECDAPLEYVENNKLSSMFNELLTQLILERPADPLTFCLTWLRWHRHTFESCDDSRPGTSPM
jgi:hypothetical protein